MKNNYILIDFENVQPKNLALLNGRPVKVFVFIGANQAKVSYELASTMHDLGSKAEYVKIAGNGPNALDFHIAFYLGQIAERDPGADFHIISKDTGFDPLIKHLKGKKISVQRKSDLSQIPLFRTSKVASSKTKTDAETKIDTILKDLSARGKARPRKTKTLANTINSLFKNTLKEKQLTALIEQLRQRGHIVIDNEKVSYKRTVSQP